MGKELEVKLEIAMAKTVELARIEKYAWKDQEKFLRMVRALLEVVDTTCSINFTTTKAKIQQAHGRFLYWQREEHTRREALRIYKEKDNE